MNGYALLTLGEIKAEGHRHTELLLGIQSSLIELPERLAAKLAASKSASTSAPGSEGSIALAWVRAITDLAKALLPLLLLAAAGMAKVAWPQALPFIRKLLESALS